jgi:hypothetical protein
MRHNLKPPFTTQITNNSLPISPYIKPQRNINILTSSPTNTNKQNTPPPPEARKLNLLETGENPLSNQFAFQHGKH